MQLGLGFRLLLLYAWVISALKTLLLPDPNSKGEAGDKVQGTHGIREVLWIVKNSFYISSCLQSSLPVWK